jgi:hypothetical protein
VRSTASAPILGLASEGNGKNLAKDGTSSIRQ